MRLRPEFDPGYFEHAVREIYENDLDNEFFDPSSVFEDEEEFAYDEDIPYYDYDYDDVNSVNGVTRHKRPHHSNPTKNFIDSNLLGEISLC